MNGGISQRITCITAILLLNPSSLSNFHLIVGMCSPICIVTLFFSFWYIIMRISLMTDWWQTEFPGFCNHAILPGGNIPPGMQAPSTNPAKPSVAGREAHALCKAENSLYIVILLLTELDCWFGFRSFNLCDCSRQGCCFFFFFLSGSLRIYFFLTISLNENLKIQVYNFPSPSFYHT